MYAIVKYTDNTMQNYDIIVKSENILKLDDILQSIRLSRKNDEYKNIYRIIKLSRKQEKLLTKNKKRL